MGLREARSCRSNMRHAFLVGVFLNVRWHASSIHKTPIDIPLDGCTQARWHTS